MQRPSSEIVQSLRTTLQQLEENFPSPEDQPHMAELKRIILLRIADLEFAEVSCQLEEDGDKGLAIARHTAQATPTVTLD